MRSALATSVSWLAGHGPTPPIPEPDGEPPDAATVRRLAPLRRPGKICGAIENPVVDEEPRIADHPAAAGLGEG